MGIMVLQVVPEFVIKHAILAVDLQMFNALAVPILEQILLQLVFVTQVIMKISIEIVKLVHLHAILVLEH